jgi:putative transcriptional regulator
MKSPKTTKKSVGARIIERLEGFRDVLQSGQKLSERFTCRKVILDLEPTQYGPEQVKQTRELLNASQALFAKFLGVSVSTVRSWEHGTNVPSAMARRFLDEIRRDPQHWLRRIHSAVRFR